jgi:beta-glucanase (GH16 family)
MRKHIVLSLVILSLFVAAAASYTPDQIRRWCSQHDTRKCRAAGFNVPARPGGGEADDRTPNGPSGDWELKWADEFSGSAVNTDRWSRSWFGDPNGYSHPINTAEDQCFHAGLATVSDGWLHLTMGRNSDPECETRSGATAKYKSGIVSSNGKYQFKYGYVEAQVNAPGEGDRMFNWSHVWTNGQHWPYDGEIDIMESLSDGSACAHVHTPAGGPGGCWRKSGVGVHTYGVEWSPQGQRFYYDGELVYSLSVPIDSPHYIILSYGHNEKTQAFVPSEMSVNYLRVWQRA